MAKILKNIGIGSKKYTINAIGSQHDQSNVDQLNGKVNETPKPHRKPIKTKKPNAHLQPQQPDNDYTDGFVYLMSQLNSDKREQKPSINSMEKSVNKFHDDERSVPTQRVATSTSRDVQGSLQWAKKNRLQRIDHVNKEIVCDEYCDPADLKLENVIGHEEIYCQPHKCEEESKDENDEQDYDNPWEWRACGKLHVALQSSRNQEKMSRQRHMYETAFDSMVKCDKSDLEEIINHPIFRNDSANSTPKITPKTPVRAITSREAATCLTPKEKRKVTLIREGRRGTEQCMLQSFNKVRDVSPAFRTERVTAVVHAPPKSANSTPSLAHRLRRIDSIGSSARSTPTHYMSSAKIKVPTKPLSDLTLAPTSSIQRNNSCAFHVVPSVVSKLKSSYSSEGRFSHQTSDGETQPSTSDSLLSDGGTDSSEMLNDKKENSNNECQNDDPRPDDDYDLPWNSRCKKRTIPFSFSLDSAQMLEAAKSQESSPAKTQQVTTEKKRPTLSLALNKQDSLPTDCNGPNNRTNLSLSFDSQTQSRKKGLQLNFGCAALSVVGEKVDSSIPLQKQGWYHGNITRVEAENVLRLLKEGSYLVRNSESNKHDYSLSLKSARGFMHMKIVHTDEKYILGQFSKPFENIPEMISHYSIYKLPIKGAEHMSLLHPVIDQLL